MINKLPKWVEVGGFVLALIAGCVNAIGLLDFKHQAVSHLTGVSTFLGLELAVGDFYGAARLMLIMLGFVLGAMYSSFIIGSASLQLGRPYGVALLSETLLLALSMVFLNLGSDLGPILAAAACGLQNAMTSTYSGALVRTTHVSGLFTDLGIMFGLRLRGHALDKRRVILYATLIAGFIVGGLIGAIAYNLVKFYALILPTALALTMAIAYWRYAHHQVRP